MLTVEEVKHGADSIQTDSMPVKVYLIMMAAWIVQ